MIINVLAWRLDQAKDDIFIAQWKEHLLTWSEVSDLSSDRSCIVLHFNMALHVTTCNTSRLDHSKQSGSPGWILVVIPSFHDSTLNHSKNNKPSSSPRSVTFSFFFSFSVLLFNEGVAWNGEEADKASLIQEAMPKPLLAHYCSNWDVKKVEQKSNYSPEISSSTLHKCTPNNKLPLRKHALCVPPLRKQLSSRQSSVKTLADFTKSLGRGSLTKTGKHLPSEVCGLSSRNNDM